MSKVPKEDQCVCTRDGAPPKAAFVVMVADEGSAVPAESGDCQSGSRSRSGDGGDGVGR
jgi:hypothetical protein